MCFPTVDATGRCFDKKKAAAITDPEEKLALAKLKIAFQAGKGPKRLVSVMIPDAGVETTNQFLFQLTAKSRNHTGG